MLDFNSTLLIMSIFLSATAMYLHLFKENGNFLIFANILSDKVELA